MATIKLAWLAHLPNVCPIFMNVRSDTSLGAQWWPTICGALDIDSTSAMEDADVAVVAFDLREMKTLGDVVSDWRQQILPSHPTVEGCLVLVGVHHGDWTQDATHVLTDTYTAGHVHEDILHQVLRLTARSSDSIFCICLAGRGRIAGESGCTHRCTK